MVTIGLIAAMAQESRALLRLVKNRKLATDGKLPTSSFSFEGESYVLITSGMGLRRAAKAARLLVDEYAPRLLISFGIAGAVEADLEIGDVVLAETYCHLENGIPTAQLPLARWPEAAFQAAAQILAARSRRVYSGTAVTTVGSQVARASLKDLLHPILEMETAGIAQVATQDGIALLSLRAVSDGPRAPIPIDISSVMDEDANLKIGRLVRTTLQNPKALFQSGQIMRNINAAAESAAIALLAAMANLSA